MGNDNDENNLKLENCKHRVEFNFVSISTTIL